MRITNNMILHNTSSNINGNKINVNNLNNQMTSQKKIQRPSEDPVIAVRALRLRSTLSEIDQYYENNIPDAESWLEITATALKNMNSILTDIRSQCVYGASDQLTADDRKTILAQLEKLRNQVYSEGNADYAGRTVFTGYRTNQKLTFMEDDKTTSYKITQSLSYQNIEEHRYYSDEVTLPTTAAEVTGNTISDPKQAIFDRVRLSYGEIDSITDKDGNVLDGGTGDATATPPVPASNKGTLGYSYTDANGVVQDDGKLDVTVYDTLEDWAAASANADNKYNIPDGEAVFIKETGDLILSAGASSTLRSGKATFDMDYTKTGFDKGEVRPEYYFNCTNVTDPANPVNYIKYENGKEIYQDIEYMVAGNQTLTVNTQASAVFDSSIGRDVDALIEAVRFAQEANAKVDEIKKMQGMQEYASDDCQAALEDWLTAAKKEADYADDNLQKLYNSYIGNFDKYLEKVNLATTDLGSREKSLALTKNRVSNQQTTVETLKSTNEDRELSDIIIDYTSAYTAYEASLQAAAKVNQNTLLNFI